MDVVRIHIELGTTDTPGWAKHPWFPIGNLSSRFHEYIRFLEHPRRPWSTYGVGGRTEAPEECDYDYSGPRFWALAVWGFPLVYDCRGRGGSEKFGPSLTPYEDVYVVPWWLRGGTYDRYVWSP